MSANEQIIFDVLQLYNYTPSQVFFKNKFPKKNYGWYVVFEDGTTFYLGQRINSALHNIQNKKIKPIAND